MCWNSIPSGRYSLTWDTVRLKITLWQCHTFTRPNQKICSLIRLLNAYQYTRPLLSFHVQVSRQKKQRSKEKKKTRFITYELGRGSSQSFPYSEYQEPSFQTVPWCLASTPVWLYCGRIVGSACPEKEVTKIVHDFKMVETMLTWQRILCNLRATKSCNHCDICQCRFRKRGASACDAGKHPSPTLEN